MLVLCAELVILLQIAFVPFGSIERAGEGRYILLYFCYNAIIVVCQPHATTKSKRMCEFE